MLASAAANSIRFSALRTQEEAGVSDSFGQDAAGASANTAPTPVFFARFVRLVMRCLPGATDTSSRGTAFRA